MHRHAGVSTHDQAVFINVVGGVRIAETAADLPSLWRWFRAFGPAACA